MTSKTPGKLTALEAIIMDCLWDNSPATVRQIQQHLHSVRPMAYNTVLTMMRILRDKGFLVSKRNGRKDVYRPRVSRQQMARRSLRTVIDRFFTGSAEDLVSELLESEDLSVDQIKAIRREVDRKLRAQST